MTLIRSVQIHTKLPSLFFLTLQEIQEALASVDSIDDNDLDADNSHDYEPEIENLGTPHPLEKEFADSLDFAERFQLSDFVVSNMTNLIGKAYGVKGGVISESI